jgi:cytochrome oxidase Cu insertion factor (SCO1/SenC/PrrC family)
MRPINKSLLFLTVVALFLAGCTGTAVNPGNAPSTQQSSPMADDAIMDKQPDTMAGDDIMDAQSEAMMSENELMAKKECEAGMSQEGDSMAEATSGDDMMAAEDDMAAEKMCDKTMDAADGMSGAEGSLEEDSMMPEPGSMVPLPGWFNLPLTNVNSGETFRVSDLKGKVVLVEPMAIWCSKCLSQQQQVQSLHGLVGERDDFVTLILAVDPNETADALKKYSNRHGFNGHYAVAPAELSREFAQLYGSQFLNPPSTPMLIIDRHGQVHSLPFGIKSAQELYQAASPFLEM